MADGRAARDRCEPHAPLPLREKLALPDGRARACGELVGHDSVHEAVAISTCSSTETSSLATLSTAESVALGILSRQAGCG